MTIWFFKNVLDLVDMNFIAQIISNVKVLAADLWRGPTSTEHHVTKFVESVKTKS